VINKMPQPLPHKLEDQRHQLIRFIENHQPEGSLKNQVVIVFDGQCGVSSPSMVSRVKVIFSKGETADDKIKRLVEESSNSKMIRVVSDDREIQYSIRANGAKVVSVAEFLRAGAKKGAGKSKARSGHVDASRPSKNISRTVESSINRELEEIWLRKKKK